MPDALTLAPAAFLAGLLMFLAPCTLPLVPGYLAFIAGVPETEVAKTGAREAKRRVMKNAFAFVLGFSFIFVGLGLFAGSIGALLLPWRDLVSRGAGVLLIIFGLTMLGALKIPFLMNEKHIKLPRFITIGRPESSFLIGALFALGWTPCIGPILGTVLLFASASATALQGALLLCLFSLGLALPFLVTAYLIGTAGPFFARMQGAVALLSKVAGGMLVVFGVYMLVGYMAFFMAWTENLFSPEIYRSLLNHL